MEQTLVLLKPDAVQRGLVGELLTRFEKKGLHIAAMKMLNMTEELARKHYRDHVDKPFFPGLLTYITSAPIVALILEGKDAVAVVRRMVGPTDGLEAPVGTIRGDYSMSKQQNLVHASDSVESAKHEITVFFA